jgi:hypothetical protein
LLLLSTLLWLLWLWLLTLLLLPLLLRGVGMGMEPWVKVWTPRKS